MKISYAYALSKHIKLSSAIKLHRQFNHEVHNLEIRCFIPHSTAIRTIPNTKCEHSKAKYPKRLLWLSLGRGARRNPEPKAKS